MERSLYEILQRAAVFLVLAQALIELRPAAGYEKYLKFLAGIMTVVILFFPLGEWLQGKRFLSYEELERQWQASASEISRQVNDISGLGDAVETPQDTYLSTINDEIKIKLNKIANEKGYHVKSAQIREIPGINGKDEEEEFMLEVLLNPDYSVISTIKVDKIKLEGESEDRERSETETELAKVMAEALGMAEERMEVRIVEGN